MRAIAIPAVVGGPFLIWACLARVEDDDSARREALTLSGPIVIGVEGGPAGEEAAAESADEPDMPPSEPETPSYWDEYVDQKRGEVAAISTQLAKARTDSAGVVNELLTRRLTDSTFSGIRTADLRAAQALTDRRFEEWQDRDQELQLTIEKFEEVSKSLSDKQADPRAAALHLGKAAMACDSASHDYRDAGRNWAQTVQMECQLCSVSDKPRSDRSVSDVALDSDLTMVAAKSPATLGQQALRFAESGERKMASHQNTVRMVRRSRTLKAVGPLHEVDRLSLANQKLYADVRQVANSLSRDPNISPERMTFLDGKLKSLTAQIEKNAAELKKASAAVRIQSTCSSGSCSR